MAQPHHFIRMKRHNLLYGRVPKAANSSIKAALCRLLSEMPPKGTKTTSDKFWQHETNQETELITLRRARKYRRSHFSFSFVRNPFDRLIAAYNNKVIEIETPPLPMQNMGVTHGMSFEAFLDVLIETPFKHYDVHVLPHHVHIRALLGHIVEIVLVLVLVLVLALATVMTELTVTTTVTVKTGDEVL